MGKLNQRKRNKGNKNRNSVIAIKCEGKNKSEKTYLENYKSRDCIIKFATGNHTDPVGMANDLVKYMQVQDISIEYGDKIYLLIDTDKKQNKQKQIDEAKRICDDNGIELITSTPTFEYWYMLHFGYTTTKYGSSQEVKNEIKKKIKGYEENMDVYPIIKSGTDIAIRNAKRVEKYQKENDKKIDSEEANPHTSIYRVIEELIKRNKKK